MTITPADPLTLPEIRGERCMLKPLRLDDVTSAYVGWLNDPEVNQYLESRFGRHTLADVGDFVAAQLADDRICFFAIWAPTATNPSGQHVGNIKLGPIDRRHLSSDLGFLLGERACWGRGIASEAIALTVQFGFSLGLKKITASAYEHNVGSIKALLKAGFAAEGVRTSQVVFGHRRVGVSLFGVACS